MPGLTESPVIAPCALTAKVTGWGVDVDERSERAALIPLRFAVLLVAFRYLYGFDVQDFCVKNDDALVGIIELR